MTGRSNIEQPAHAHRQGWRLCLLLGGMAFLLAGATLIWHAYTHHLGRKQDDLLGQVVQDARGINPQKVQALTGTDADRQSAEYRRLKRQLTLLRENNPGVRFVYLMRRNPDGQVVLLVDSEPEDSTDYSPPGDVYHEAGPDEEEFFTTGVPRVFPPETDRWGRWVSGYAPVWDPDTGVVLALYGVDIDAADWQWALYRSLQWPLLLMVVLGALLVLVCRLLARAQQTGRVSWAIAYGEYIVIGCLGGLLTAYAAWFAHDLEGRRIYRSFSQLADSKLDRLQQRLEHMRDFSLPFAARYLDLFPQMDPVQFGKLVEPFLDRPGEHSWGWVSVVTLGERAPFEQTYADWMEEIWEVDEEGKRIAVSDRHVHYPLKAVFPVERYGDAMGFDLGSEPKRRAAIEAAEQSRLPSATQPLDLFTSGPNRRALLVLQPVFMPADQSTLRGLIVAALNIEQLMRQIWPSPRLHYSISVLQPGEPEQLQYTSCPHPDHPLFAHKLIRNVGLFGQVLKMEVHPGAPFYTMHPRRAAVITSVVGALLTAALMVLLGVPLRKKRGLEALVAQRTLNLKDSEKRYEMLASRSRTVVWEVDLNGRYTGVSPNAEAVFGYTPSELIGRKYIYDLAPKRDRQESKDRVLEMMQTGGTDQNYENRIVTKSGDERWVSTTALPNYDEQGALVGYVGWDRDIHSRKMAELEKNRLLAEAEESRRMLLSVIEDQQRTEGERARLATAIEQSPETIVITDVTGKIEYVNPAFERVTGYTAAEVIGENPRILKSGEQGEAFYTEMWHTIAQGEVWSGKVVNRSKDGRLFTEEVTISPVRDENGAVTHFIAIKRDITDELERERMYQQSQKMDSIGRLAGGIAHDFNNMLQVILGNTELAMESAGENEWLKQDLEQVKSAAKRSVELTRQLLAFASRQSVKPQVIDLKAAVPGLMDMLRRLLDANISLDWIPGGETACIKIDPSQLDQILINLCVNARDAITGQGQITITTACTHLSGKKMLLGEYPKVGEYVVLSVTDSGCGMDEEIVQQIFEPFFTTKTSGKGSGLGLSTVYGIVRQNNGYIQVNSALGKGTEFEIFFPACSDPAISGEESAAVAGNQKAIKAGILVVEDELSILNLTKRTLEKAGFTVWAANSPQAALELLDTHTDEIDLLITDVIMPEMNGKELADAVAQKCPHIKFLFMSGYSEEVIARNGILPGNMNFLQKPFTADAMSKAIQAALAT